MVRAHRSPRLGRIGVLAFVASECLACGDNSGGKPDYTGSRSPGSGGAVAGKGGASAGGAGGTPASGGAATSTGGASASGGGAGTSGRTGNGGAPADAGDDSSPGSGGAAGNAGSGGASGRGDAGTGAGGAPLFVGEGDPWLAPAPRATCRTGDTGETDIQGLGTDVRCNFDIVGQLPVDHFLSFAWQNECAYVNGTTATTVIDVGDPSKPVVTGQLTTAGMQSNWESMKVHHDRGLLVGYQSNGAVLDVYDVHQDCKAPVLKKSYNLGGSGHAGNFSVDGTIYYASSLFTSQVFAVDLTDPTNPSVLTSTFDRSTHDLSIGKDGTRGYFVFTNLITFASGSLAIMDLSSIQSRAMAPKGTLIKEISWDDGAASQYPIPVTYKGKDFVITTDELGSGNCNDPKKPQYGYAHIFDISDEQAPILASKVKTQAQDPAFCQQALAQGGGGFGVGTHYCNVDRQVDPRLLSCGLWSAGVRLYDIRNPWRPKEVAYFNVPDTQVPGLTRILPKERQLWFTTTKTFYVLRLPEAVVGDILSE